MGVARTKIIGLFRLLRFELPFSAGICVILGEFLAAGSIPPFSALLSGFVSIFCISATALILNDCFDYETDKVNAPQRPLPAGMLTRQEAVVFSIVVALIGMVTSAAISPTALVVAMIVWAVGVAYNGRFKRTGLPGNILVAFSVGMTFVFGGIVVGHPTDGLVLWFGLLALFFDLGEEIAADAMDVEGDRLIGSRSLAIVLGPQRALQISTLVFALVVLTSLAPFALRWLEAIYLAPILLMDGIIAYSLGRLWAPQAKQPRRYIRWIYLGGSFSIWVFILMRTFL